MQRYSNLGRHAASLDRLLPPFFFEACLLPNPRLSACQSQVQEAVLAPRQGVLKGRDRLFAARAFFEALQLQKDKKASALASFPCRVLSISPLSQVVSTSGCRWSCHTRPAVAIVFLLPAHEVKSISGRPGRECIERGMAEADRLSHRVHAGPAHTEGAAGFHCGGTSSQLGSAAQPAAAAVAEHRRLRQREPAGVRHRHTADQATCQWRSTPVDSSQLIMTPRRYSHQLHQRESQLEGALVDEGLGPVRPQVQGRHRTWPGPGLRLHNGGVGSGRSGAEGSCLGSMPWQHGNAGPGNHRGGMSAGHLLNKADCGRCCQVTAGSATCRRCRHVSHELAPLVHRICSGTEDPLCGCC